MKNIRILQGDITHFSGDAIVNAANSSLLGGGGVDGAIHRAAGPALLQACKKIPVINGVRCPSGEARITPAGNLKVNYVIHTVGPVYHRDPNPEKTLQSAYRNSGILALENRCQTIAFPAISCGVYAYPHEEAASIALSTLGEKPFDQLDISFYIFGEALLSVFEKTLNRLY